MSNQDFRAGAFFRINGARTRYFETVGVFEQLRECQQEFEWRLTSSFDLVHLTAQVTRRVLHLPVYEREGGKGEETVRQVMCRMLHRTRS